MKTLTLSGLALSAAIFASGNVAHAQQAKRVFFEGDIIRGNQAGAPGPFCVLNNQFKRLEKVVFRIRVLDQDGKSLDDKGIKSLFVELPGGQRLQAGYNQHPPRGEAADHFWSAAWIIPTEQPTGTFAYKATVTSLDGQTQSWEPFKIKGTQFAVVDGAIEIKPPVAAPKQ